MNKLFKSFVIVVTMLFLLSPICFGTTPELKKQIKKQIKKEDGSLFEKIIAECIGGIAETVLDFTTRRKSKCRI